MSIQIFYKWNHISITSITLVFLSQLTRYRAEAAGYSRQKASLALSESMAGSPVAESPDLKVPEKGSSGLPTPAVASASVEHNTVI